MLQAGEYHLVASPLILNDSASYDRYWTGRTAWSDVMRTTRTLTRLIWFHVPLRLTPKTTDEIGSGDMATRSTAEVRKVMKEKNMAIDLVNGYVEIM